MDDDGSTADAARTGQVARSAAHVYEEFFVPALFGQWPELLLDAADIAAGQHVLDVGCGTGVLARAAHSRVGVSGGVVGLDPNDGMLAVARDAAPDITWRSGSAEALPFGADQFDHTVSQFALMFFSDRPGAVAEMARVTRHGGSVVIATWASLETSPGYAALADVLDDVLGADARDALLAPFCVGTEALVVEQFAQVDGPVSVTRHDGVARFESLHAWLHTDVRGWTLSDQVDDRQFDELVATARSRLDRFVQPDGSVNFAAPALVASCTV